MSTDAAQTAPASSGTFLPGPVLLLGAPGVGKGTQAQALMAKFGILQISTGDILRSNVEHGTPLGLEAQALMAAGQFVPDRVVNQMVWHTIVIENTYDGFVLDGYPRTLAQAQFIDAALADAKFPPNFPIVAVSITVAYEQLLHRITGRRTCPACKSIYNVWSNPPKTKYICDLDGTDLIQRTDDSEEVFAERMKTFEAQTAPVIEHYRAQGRFEQIDGDRAVEAVTSAITDALKRLRGVQV